MRLSRPLHCLKWLIICVVSAIVFVETHFPIWGRFRLQQHTLKTQATLNAKSHIYLVQAPKCLPSHLASSDYVGIERICHCDVIVFSFQEKCESSPLRHVEYVYLKNKTTWSQGRNILLARAKRRGREYKYYIFLDDDVKLSFREDFPKVRQQRMSSLRAFEKFLEDYEPAVGLTDYVNHHGLNVTVSKRRRLCKHSGPPKPLHVPEAFGFSFGRFTNALDLICSLL